MGDKIHPTHFQITKDMPWREKEKQAVLFLKEILLSWENREDLVDFENRFISVGAENKELWKWVTEYELG